MYLFVVLVYIYVCVCMRACMRVLVNVCVRMCVSVVQSPEASSRLFDITLYLYALLYCCCCMFCFLWVLTCVACIFFSCLLAAQSVKVARSLSSPNAGISNTAGNFILNAHYLLCCFIFHAIDDYLSTFFMCIYNKINVTIQLH